MAAFEMPWRTLAPGWRWVIWGAGAGFAGGPLVLHVAFVGWPSWGGVLQGVLLGLPWLAVYLLLVCCKRRSEAFAVLVLLALVGGVLLPGFC